MYQGRIVADNILGLIFGRDRRARYKGVPRVVFADPEIAAVGITAEQAAHIGVAFVSANMDLADAIT